MSQGNKTPLFSRRQPGGVFTIVDERQGTGNIWWVDSGSAQAVDSVGSGQNPEGPFATIDYAIGMCEENNGDIIYVMPGHTETVTAAGGITCDKAGISIIGLGVGSDRPTITFTTADTGDIEIDSANVRIKNMIFVGGFESLAAMIDVDAAYFTIEDCDFYVNAADHDIHITIITDANANDITVRNCTFNYLVTTDGTTAVTETSTEAIRLVGADRARIEGCYFSGDFTTSAINSVSTASKDIKILNNVINNIATENIAGGIDLHASTTGFVDGNKVYVAYTNSATGLIDDGSCVVGLNYVNNATSEAMALFAQSETSDATVSVGVIASGIRSEVGSVGGLVSGISTANSTIKSSATKISTASSSISSAATLHSTILSEVGSVGVKASTIGSRVGSVGKKASTAVSTGTVISSKATSLGTRNSTILSEVGSVGVKASTVLSEVGSVGVKASTAISTGTIVSSKATSVGTKTSTILSTLHSLATFCSTRFSLIDSQVS